MESPIVQHIDQMSRRAHTHRQCKKHHETLGVIPLGDALAMASDFLFLAKALTKDAAYAKDTDYHAWAAHYLTVMSKAVVDDAVKVLTRDREFVPVPKRAAKAEG